MPPPKQQPPIPIPTEKNLPKQPGPAKETGFHFAVLDEGTFSVPHLRCSQPLGDATGSPSHPFEV